MDIYHKILADYWGYTEFRPLQADIIHSIAAGKDTLGLMPTGGGKSITFQVPTMAMDGLCLVVTPLIALMKDQVENLRRIGIKATAVYSGMSRQEIITNLENCIFGDYKFLYVSPERLATDIFRAKLMTMKVCLLVVDESHCISQWGYDFRPAYLRIADIRVMLPSVPVLALTASATPEVVNDIQDNLGFKERNVFSKSFARPNISYVVRKTEDKLDTLLHILKRVSGTAIVYVRNRQRTTEIAIALQQAGISADFYHAGLRREVKEARQNRWKNGECRVIVCTNAFGMGIDKPDVRLVVHINMPGSLEEYYQEAGRAGRDGLRSYAVALISSRDANLLRNRVTDEFPEKAFIYRVYEALGNYYQIAVGFGLETVHDFILEDFCTAYHFPMLQTHHALRILDLSGYIEYTEEVDNASRLMFTATREELYRSQHDSQRTNEILLAILRSYEGLFADYVYVDERIIATRSNTTPQEVYDTLIGLSKIRVVSYIPHKRVPLIIYTQTREDQRYLTIPRSAYEERQERFSRRINRVLDYIKDEKVCRSQQLLSYFGEVGSAPCGCCDVCLSKHGSQLRHWEFEKIRASLLQRLTDQSPVLVRNLLEELSIPTEKGLRAIRFLADQDDRFTLRDGYLEVRKE